MGQLVGAGAQVRDHDFADSQAHVVSLTRVSRPLCILYTDASWEIVHTSEDTEWINAGLGSVLFPGSGGAKAWASQLPQRWLPLLNPRKTQIVMCEAVALLDCLVAAKEDIAGQDLLIFVDNIALVCSLVKGSSTHSDIQGIVTIMHVFLASIGTIWWIEWVPSALNCADGPSREGLADAWCAEMNIEVQALPDCGLLTEETSWLPDAAWFT